MTAAQIRAEVEKAKATAMARFAKDYGPNAITGLAKLREGNAKALESICRTLGETAQ